MNAIDRAAGTLEAIGAHANVLRTELDELRAELAAWETFGPKPQLRALVAAAIAYGRHPEPWNDDRVIDSLLDAASNYELAH